MEFTPYQAAQPLLNKYFENSGGFFMSKLLVAIDPFTKVDANLRRAMQSVRAIANQLDARLQAVGVVSPDQLKLPIDFEKNIADEFVSSAQKSIVKKQNDLKVHFDLEPEVAVQPYRSSKRTIQAVDQAARDSKADIVAVITHPKTKSHRSLFGFVGSLINLSSKPVLAVNAEAKPAAKIQQILFATDYNNQSKPAFLRTLDLAKTLGAKMIVVHKSFDITEYAALASGLAPLVEAYEPIMLAEEERVQRTSDEWKKSAESKGVEVEFVVTRRSGTVTDVVLKMAQRRKCELIVCVAETGKYEALFVGSTTRALLKNSKTPVLVIRQTLNEKGIQNEKSSRKNSKVHDDQSANRKTERNGRTSVPNY